MSLKLRTQCNVSERSASDELRYIVYSYPSLFTRVQRPPSSGERGEAAQSLLARRSLANNCGYTRPRNRAPLISRLVTAARIIPRCWINGVSFPRFLPRTLASFHWQRAGGERSAGSPSVDAAATGAFDLELTAR